MLVKSETLDAVKWTADGLVPVIVSQAEGGKVLMFAWMNRDALAKTIELRRAVFWSRSRQKLWYKGESSGHVQHVRDIRMDCDNDVIMLAVEQEGGIACHTGRESCFFRELNSDGEWCDVEPVLKSPDEIYR